MSVLVGVWGIMPNTPLRGCYTLARPYCFVYNSFKHLFCQGIAPKKFARQSLQNFSRP